MGVPPVQGERKLVTILFADVAGSTSLAERLDPEDWANIMNGAFAFMNASVDRFGGTVSRLMGDAVLALFGAPLTHEDDPERAVLAAIDMRRATLPYGEAVRRRHGVDFTLRIGINTGTAVLALVGSEAKAEYTAMGDAANVAARLQSVAGPGSILVGGETHRLVRARFEFEPRGPIEMKGRRDPVEVFEVVGPRVAPGSARGIEGLRSPLVGRDGHLARLRERIEALAEGRGGVVAVIGDAGVGKSRLVAELREEAEADSRGPLWHEGRAISYAQSLPYHPWQQIGRALIGARPMDGPEAVRERLRAFVARLGLSETHLTLFEALLAVETPEGRSALGRLDRDALLREIHEAVLESLRRVIREGRADGKTSLVLAFDDLHWSDPASLDLLVQAAGLAETEPLLLLLALRPDRGSPGWSALERLAAPGEDGPRLDRIELQPLEPGEAGLLLGNLLEVQGLPGRLRDLILERAEGNPFFLEEVIRSLIDSGHIVRRSGCWRATGSVEEVTIPETLAGVLGSRLDRLPEPTKRVAQTASVLGRVFPYRALSEVCRSAPPRERIDDVDPHLGTLTYEELVRERARDPEREFIFKHALTCEAAYGLLLRVHRRELHGRVGLALEDLYPDRLEELAPILAHHFAEGGDAVRASEYGLRAGARALRLHALDEALGHFEHAVRQLESVPDAPPGSVADAVLAWTETRTRAGRFEGVLERLLRAEPLARETGDPTRIARTLVWIANVHVLTGFPSRAVPYLLEAESLARELGDDSLALLPLFLATETLLDQDPAQAVGKFEELLALAREHRALEIEGHAMALLALGYARIGRFDDAERTIEEALELAPRVGSTVKEADIYIGAGMAYNEMGDIPRALEHARRGAELAHSVQALECACAGYFGAGMVNLERRDLDGALRDFDRSLDMAGFAGWEGWVNRIRGGMAAAEFLGGSAEAVSQLEAALENARTGHDGFMTYGLAERLAAAYLHLGRNADAASRLEEAVAGYRRLSLLPGLARALELRAVLDEREGRAEDAEAARAEASSLRAGFRRRPPEAAAGVAAGLASS